MAADIFNTPVATVNVTQGSAYGAALLAMTGSGQFSDARDAMKTFVRPKETIDATKLADEYDTLHGEWRTLYGILEPTYTVK